MGEVPGSCLISVMPNRGCISLDPLGLKIESQDTSNTKMVGSSNNQIGVTPVKDEGARKQEEAGKVFGSDSCDRRAPHSVQL